jgi:hypothetical protein
MGFKNGKLFYNYKMNELPERLIDRIASAQQLDDRYH